MLVNSWIFSASFLLGKLHPFASAETYEAEHPSLLAISRVSMPDFFTHSPKAV
jgi:hypothetical protein